MKGYRTLIANILMALSSIAAVNGIDIPPELVEEVTGGIIGVITLVNLILRSITTTPMGKKE